MEYRVIDKDGVVVNTLGEGDRIVRKNSMRHLREEEGKMKLPKDEEFIKYQQNLPKCQRIEVVHRGINITSLGKKLLDLCVTKVK